MATNNGKQLKCINQLKEMINPNSGYYRRFYEVLKGDTAQYLAAVLGNVSRSVKLQECTPESILACAMQAATYGLSINPELGQAYIIPYGGKAQFQLGVKGIKQLAIATGQYNSLNAEIVFEDEEVIEDPLSGDVSIKFNRAEGSLYKKHYSPAPDAQGRPQQVKTTLRGLISDGAKGVFAFFRMGGYQHTEYWPLERVVSHAMRYSKSFNSGPWQENFDSMAKKTVLKLALTNYGYLAGTVRKALSDDQKVYSGIQGDEGQYLDNPAYEAEYEQKEAPVPERKNPTQSDVLERIQPQAQPQQDSTAKFQQILKAFQPFGVGAFEISGFLGHSIDELTPQDEQRLSQALNELMNGRPINEIFRVDDGEFDLSF